MLHPTPPRQANPGASAAGRWQRNRAHWERTLDAQNLKGSGGSDFRRQLALYQTADVRFAVAAMEPLAGRLVLDVGGGLALAAILMAHRGATVVISDISLNRLREARKLVARLGLAGRIHFVVGKAEQMPFPASAFHRLFTKSVLIHTDLPRAAAECARILAPAGIATFIEPQKRNPLVNLYRRLLAPKVWQDITTYFGPAQWRTVSTAFPKSKISQHPFFLLGFLASAFSFALPNPALYRVMESVTSAIDQILFRLIPASQKRAWFGVMVVRK